jgi:predicted amidohydrolase YtcJ
LIPRRPHHSKAFALAGVTKNALESDAGTFDRDASGELNGRVTDRARAVFNNVGMRPSYTADQTQLRDRDALTFISKQFVHYGLTSVRHEGGDLFALQQVRARGDLPHRVSYEAIRR